MYSSNDNLRDNSLHSGIPSWSSILSVEICVRVDSSVLATIFILCLDQRLDHRFLRCWSCTCVSLPSLLMRYQMSCMGGRVGCWRVGVQQPSYKYVDLLHNQQSQYQMEIRQQKFTLPENSESLPTFRQVGNYLNTISSASTIFLERDNTHTRLESQLKLNSNKPSLDLEMPSNLLGKNESNILSYSLSSSLIFFEDSLMHLQKLIMLFASKDHLFNHISQSLALTGHTLESSKSIAKIIATSFNEYTQTALKVDFKAIKGEISTSSAKIAALSKQAIQLKQQNLRLFQKIVCLQNQNIRYRKKIVSLKEKMKSPQQAGVTSMFKKNYSQLMNKMVNFETVILQKLIGLQTPLLNVTNFRNRLLKANCFNRHTHIPKQNKSQPEIKKQIERHPMKQLSQNNLPNRQIQSLENIIQENGEQVAQLNKEIQDLLAQLSEQKDLYEQMLDKNIQLQKQMFLMGLQTKVKSEEESESFCVMDQKHYMEYINEEMGQMCQSPISQFQ